MIVSHRHRFIFVKTMKTAGSSIEAALARHCGDDDVLTPIHPPIAGHHARNHRGLFWPFAGAADLAELRANFRDLSARRKFYNHIPARQARARLGRRIWEGYFTFCVERNPWDKTLSHYHMFRNAAWHARHDPDLTLEKYFENAIFCRNAGFYCDRDGEIMVDRVLRHDRLDVEMAQVMDQLGLPFDGLPRAKSDLRTDRRSYREVLSAAQAKQVEAEFEREIALHGWEY